MAIRSARLSSSAPRTCFRYCLLYTGFSSDNGLSTLLQRNPWGKACNPGCSRYRLAMGLVTGASTVLGQTTLGILSHKSSATERIRWRLTCSRYGVIVRASQRFSLPRKSGCSGKRRISLHLLQVQKPLPLYPAPSHGIRGRVVVCVVGSIVQRYLNVGTYCGAWKTPISANSRRLRTAS
jgi:hypothetical protein